MPHRKYGLTDYCDYCPRPIHAHYLCRIHYLRRWRKWRRVQDRIDRETLCCHLNCREPATAVFTWPHPINRAERVCAEHAEPLLDEVIPGLKYQPLEEP